MAVNKPIKIVDELGVGRQFCCHVAVKGEQHPVGAEHLTGLEFSPFEEVAQLDYSIFAGKHTGKVSLKGDKSEIQRPAGAIEDGHMDRALAEIIFCKALNRRARIHVKEENAVVGRISVAHGAVPSGRHTFRPAQSQFPGPCHRQYFAFRCGAVHLSRSMQRTGGCFHILR